MPDVEYALKTDFQELKSDLRDAEKRFSSEITENRQKIQENSEDISELRAMYKNLADLPNTMNSLDKTIVKVCDRLDNMDINIKAMNESIRSAMEHNKEQDKQMDEIDNKSKVDWASFITDNFWKIILTCGVLYYIVKDLVQ